MANSRYNRMSLSAIVSNLLLRYMLKDFNPYEKDGDYS
jgi:hypothetical protein